MREISRYRREIFGKQKYKNRQHYIPVQTTYGNGMVGRSSYDDIHHRLAWRELYDTYHIPLQETQYEYDGVGNIVRTRQYASARGGLGGEYAVVYGYDEQNRLLNARQYNSEIGDYDYFMSYSPSGLVGTKVSPELNADMVFGYRYDGGYISHQPKIISSVSDEEDVTLMGWNTNGQMTSMVQPNQDRFRKHMWDEAGQLAVAIGNEYCGYYGYNANGERVYKLTGTVLADQYDAGEVNIETYFDDIVLYVNPYMVVTPRGYTKHYYNGSQRIAARLGGSWTKDSTFVQNQQWIAQAESLWETTTNTNDLDEQEILSEDVYVGGNGSALPACQYSPNITQLSGYFSTNLLSSVFSGQASERTLTDTIGIYFYHPDHLGSANWITNSQGQAVQYIHYMPYGEVWVNQQTSRYDERFKFTGKERDAETGYDYFGARYYLSLLGIWMSPDPLLDEYPKLSSYAYCNWNPINRLDPDGMIDYDMVKMGLSTMAIGGGTAVGGAAISATGVGSPVGALLIVDGIAGVGIGASLSITGLLTDPSEQNTYIMNNIPTNATSAITKSADQIAGNEHHQIEYTVNGILLVAGLSQPTSYSNKAEEIYSLLTTGVAGEQLLSNVGREIISTKSFIEERVTINTTTLPNDNTRVYTIDIYKPHLIEYE